MGVLRYEWRRHVAAAGSAAFKLLIEMEVATLYYFVGGNSIQTGAVGDSKANFFSNIKDGNFLASPSIHPPILRFFGR